MQPAKSTKYLCLFLCGICSDYTLQNQGLCGLLWLCLFGWENYTTKGNVGGDVATCCP